MELAKQILSRCFTLSEIVENAPIDSFESCNNDDLYNTNTMYSSVQTISVCNEPIHNTKYPLFVLNGIFCASSWASIIVWSLISGIISFNADTLIYDANKSNDTAAPICGP